MELNKLILGLALNTRDCIDYLKVNKDRHVSRALHGAKKNIIRYLYSNFPVLECRRVLQFCDHIRKPNYGICMVRFSFDVLGRVITFHLPSDDVTYMAMTFKYTTRKVMIIHGVIPPTNVSSYTSLEHINDVIKLLNCMDNMKWHQTSKNSTETASQRYIRKLEEFITQESPLKLAL